MGRFRHGRCSVDHGRRQPKEVATRAGHSSVSFTLDRYGHLYRKSDTVLRDRLDALYAVGDQAEPGMVIELPRDRSRPHRGLTTG
jgi:hypothetical protein